jgi:zinc transporter
LECGLLIGDGPFRRLTVAEAETYEGPGFVWLHLHGRDEEDAACLKRQATHVPDVAASALFATETRPRCDQIDSGAIVNLRGPGENDPNDSDRLVSIRLWVTSRRVTSVSRRRMTATAEVMRKMEAGLIQDPGDLVAAYARAISLQLDPQVAGLGDTLDDIESDLENPKSLYGHRRTITRIRSEAIGFRRFVAPDRDALLTLAALDFDWLSEEDRLHIKEAADKFARMTEELEAVRERSALLHEQITDLRAEQLDQRGLEISIIAFIFLPLTFITGLLGMNVQGIPYAEEPWAFWAVVLFCVVLSALVAAYFIWRHKVHTKE